MMNGDGKSDSSIVPEKPANKATQVAAEVVEGRELAKGNLPECNTPRTLSRTERAKRAQASVSSSEEGQ